MIFAERFPPKPKIVAEKFGSSNLLAYLCPKKYSNDKVMTTVELRTSILAELDQMNVEMLENVSDYIKRLRHHSRPASQVSIQDKRDVAMLFVKNFSVRGNVPVPADERGIDALVDELFKR